MNKDSPIIKDLVFEINNECPNECLFCSSKASPVWNEVISFELFKNTIDSIINNFWVEKISISWWEPLLHKDILDMVKYCKDKALHTTIYTSWIRKREKIDIDLALKIEEMSFPKDFPEKNKQIILERTKDILQKENQIKFSQTNWKIFNELKQNWLDKIIFDFQCDNEDSYQELMWCNRGLIYVLQSLHNARNAKIPTEFHFIPLKSNIKEFMGIVEFAEIWDYNEEASIKINILKFVPQWRWKENKKSLQLSEKELQDFLNYVRGIETKVPIRIWIPLLSENSYQCSAWVDKLVIRYDWVVLPCPAFKDIDKNELLKKWMILWNIKEWDINMMKWKRKIPLCDLFYEKN